MVDAVSVCTLERLGDFLLLNLILSDENNNRLLFIRNSVIDYVDEHISIAMEDKELRVQRKDDDIFVMQMKQPNKVVLSHANLLLNGALVGVAGDALMIGGGVVNPNLLKESSPKIDYIVSIGKQHPGDYLKEVSLLHLPELNRYTGLSY